MPIKVSIILLHYANVEATLHCLSSLKKLPSDFEIIVVDNDSRRLLPRLKGVKYVSTGRNLGYGGGINYGIGFARGEYLFILNNDCYVLPDSLSRLVEFLDTQPETALVSPMLLDKDRTPYSEVGTYRLTPLSALFSLTSLNKYWPNNPVSRRYWVKTLGLSQPTSIDVVPGTAFLARASIFRKVGGFDSKFLLYFEEADLCKRIKDLGYSIFLLPAAQVIHYWAQSTPKDAGIKSIFARSRFYYFRKHYGYLWAFLIHLATMPSHIHLLSGILILGTFLRFFRLSSTMMFIGDFAWFYDSAKNALLTGSMPMSGIASSVTWLHQGPLWTYLLIPGLLISRFHPVSGAIFTCLLGSLTLLLTYFLGRTWSNKTAALLAAFTLAVSPLAVIHSRMPYHTSVIPFFFVVFLLLLSRHRYFWAFLFLGFLYQLELATVILWPIALFTLLRDRSRKILLSVIGFILGILPFIISGPIQTFGVFIWSVYHLLFHRISAVPATSFYIDLISRFIFPYSQYLSLGILFICIIVSLRYYRHFLLWLLFPLFAMFVNRTPSEAYFTILMIPLALSIGYAFRHLPKYLPLILFINIIFLTSTSYLSDTGHYGPPLASRINLSKQILTQSSTASPRIITRGPGDQFATFQLPYPYLVWWLSHSISPSGSNETFVIIENTQSLRVLK